MGRLWEARDGMKIPNNNVDKRHQISINKRRDKDGNPVDGLVITQARGFILIGRDEWEEIRRAGDAIIAEQKPRKRYRMA